MPVKALAACTLFWFLRFVFNAPRQNAEHLAALCFIVPHAVFALFHFITAQ
jgi:hypothetical protein